jgi:uroporphyrinogen-III synthase
MRPRILITRALHQASALADSLRTFGCEPILVPTIEIAPPTNFFTLDAALGRLHTFDWLIFTSANAVEAFHSRLSEVTQSWVPHPRDSTIVPGVGVLPAKLRIASIGPATTRAIEKLFGTKPSLVPPVAVAESLANALVALTENPQEAPFSRSFLFPHAEDARKVLEAVLNRPKIEFTSVTVYRNIIPESSISIIRQLFTPGNYPDAITFTSSSTAINLLALLEVSGLALPPEIPRISIGPITTQTLRDLHISPTAEAAEPTIPSLSAAVLKALRFK